MKKIAILLLLSISLMFVVVGCAKKDDGEGNELEPNPTYGSEDEDTNGEGNGENNEATMDPFVPLVNPVVKEEYDFNSYIKLGKYKGVEVEIKKLVVTEADIDISIQMDLLDNGATPIDVTDRAVTLGDTINIDFAGYHNGELFDGGSAEGYEIVVGSQMFIDGFEEQLVGAELNKEIDINVVFPENYNNQALAGEPAVFKVKVNSIQYFELTEDFVNSTMGFDSEKEYMDSIRQDLIISNEDIMKRKKENEVYNAVINGSEITLPDNLLKYYESDLRTLYTNFAAGYGMDLESFVELSGYSMNAFELDAQAYSKDMATRELVVKAISATEGIELTEEEFQTIAGEYAEQYGYESKEEFLEEADVSALKDDLLYNKIKEFIVAESIEI